MIVYYFAPRLFILELFPLTLPHYVSMSYQLRLLDPPPLLVSPLVIFLSTYSMFSKNQAPFISGSVLVTISFLNF